MDSLKSLRQQLTGLKAERSMLIRQGQSHGDIDTAIANVKQQIAGLNATVAEVNAAGRFAPDEPSVTDHELIDMDIAIGSDIRQRGEWGYREFRRYKGVMFG